MLRAAGVEGESGFPYAALHQLLRPLRRAVRELGGEPGEALRASLGFSEEGVPDPPSVAAALVSLARDAGPGTVCVDDWQWVDAESRAAIEAFIASGVGVPVLLGGHGAGPVGVAELAVGPLDPVASSALLGAGLPLLVRERVLREAAGRPLALMELPLAYAGAGDGVLLGSWAPLTGVLEEAFADGLEALEPVCAAAVLVAALDDGGRLGDVLSAAAVLVGRELSEDGLGPGGGVRADRAGRRPVGVRASADARGGPARLEPGGAGGGPPGVRVRRGRARPRPRDLAPRRERSRDGRSAGRRAGGRRAALACGRATTNAPRPDCAAPRTSLPRATSAAAGWSRPRSSRRRSAASRSPTVSSKRRCPHTWMPSATPACWRCGSRASASSLAAAARACPDPDLALRLWWRAATEIQAGGGDGAALAREAVARAEAASAPAVSLGADGRANRPPTR